MTAAVGAALLAALRPLVLPVSVQQIDQLQEEPIPAGLPFFDPFGSVVVNSPSALDAVVSFLHQAVHGGRQAPA